MAAKCLQLGQVGKAGQGEGQWEAPRLERQVGMHPVGPSEWAGGMEL